MQRAEQARQIQGCLRLRSRQETKGNIAVVRHWQHYPRLTRIGGETGNIQIVVELNRIPPNASEVSSTYMYIMIQLSAMYKLKVYIYT